MRAERGEMMRLLRTARGQIDGVMKMVEEDRYCVDISHQIMAAEAVLKRANREILKSHISGCVAEAFSSDEAEVKDKNVAEILSIVEKLTKQ